MGAVLRAWGRLGLSIQILIGLGLGIATGLFFGESAAGLRPLSDVYIRLMQMTVLPYLITALIVAFGQLDVREAKRLAVRGAVLLLLVWATMMLVITAMPMAFPTIESASFYSNTLVAPPKEVSLAELYFTANPFESLSRNAVPAIVLFCCMVGVALIGSQNKARLLDPLRVWNEAIVRITRFVIGLTPIGVFAIGAVTAGTMTMDVFVRLEAYFIAFAAASLLLGFVLLPLAVTAMTPFRYGEIVAVGRDALLTAFVAQNAFIVLPLLIDRSKELLARHDFLDEQTDSAADVIIPVLFNFPHAGKLLTLLFVPFAAWLSGVALDAGDYPELFGVGIPSYFAKAQIALPFILDVFAIPHDLFLLYIPTTIITGKFDSMVAAMNLLVFALLGAASMGNKLVFDRWRLLRAGAIGGAALVGTVVAVRVILALTIDTSYHGDEQLRRMERLNGDVETVVRSGPADVEPDPLGDDAVAQIRRRGALRVGFDPENLPFSFLNDDGQLVGFDVEVALMLVRELGLAAEFVPVEWRRIPALLEAGVIDVMPGMWYRPNWFGSLRFTAPYMEGTMGFAVRDERRDAFASIDDLRQSTGLVIGIPLDERQTQYSVARYFGDAAVEFRVVDFWGSFFEGQHPDLDAFLMPVEHASGWSLLHPEYAVVVPQPNPIRISTAFGVARGNDDLARAIDEWIVFADNTRQIERAYEHWVLGQGARVKTPRWSVMRNVLGWEWGR